MKTIEQIQAERNQLRADLDQREKELRQAKLEAKQKLRIEQAQKEDEHRATMSQRYSVPRGDWFDLAYSLAWQHGHCSGFSEVESYFADIAELYKIER